MRSVRAVFAAAALCVMVPAPAQADGPTVTGAGSTWSQIAVDQWRADAAKFGLSVNYQGVGSSAGRQFYLIDQVDFAVSEIPFLPDELEKLRSKDKSFQYSPIVAGGTSMMYNLRDVQGQAIKTLRLSTETISLIFTGGIENWSDPKIKADNPNLRLPDQAIIPVIRSDGSGTSAQFSAFIDSVESSIWDSFAAANNIPPEPTSYWPNFSGSVSQKGSDGVANYVANDSTGVGSIGYVEAGYAFQRGRPVASIKNVSGAYTQPTARNVAIALTQAELNSDRTQNLSRVYVYNHPDTYPISSYSYLISETKGFDPAKGAVLGRFMIYMACEGQQSAEILGYSPLPPNLVEAVFDAVRNIPGAPAPPPIKECNNPTISAGSAVEGTSGESVDGAAGTVKGEGSSGSSGDGSGGSGSGGDGGGNGGVGGGNGDGGGGASNGGGEGTDPSVLADTQGDTSEVAPPSERDLELARAAGEGFPGPDPLPFVIAGLVVALVVFGPTVGRSMIPVWRR